MVDNFERAGLIWRRVWSAIGLTCLSQRNGIASVSKLKVAYCIFIFLLFLLFTYLRIQAHVLDRRNLIITSVQLISACVSLFCAAFMALLTVLNQNRGAAILTEMNHLKRKYSLEDTRSLLSYFPPSCVLPCLSVILENIIFAVVTSSAISPVILTSYFFFFYNYIFYAKVLYYSSLPERGFRRVNKCLKELETTALMRSHWDKAETELRRLRAMYHEIFDFSGRLDELFSSRVVLIIGHNFTNCVMFTFNAIYESVAHRSSFRFIHWITAFYLAACCFYGLYVMVRPCGKITREARFTAIAVQSLSTRPGYSSIFYNELRLFSTQIVLEDMDSDTNDFLNLNNHMLLSAVGAICSSLAILLQMN